MDVLLNPEIWVALLTLTALEIVLGIDNIVFISILANKLPEEERDNARRVGILAAIYPGVWGLGQLYTGALSDRIGRKPLIVGGMLTQAAAIAWMAAASGFWPWAIGAAVLGAGTAMVYPTLLAVIGDVAHPTWRARSVGIYRLWRDAGFAVGALLAGVLAATFGAAVVAQPCTGEIVLANSGGLHGNTTPTSIQTTPKPRNASKRSMRPMRCFLTRRSARCTISSGRTSNGWVAQVVRLRVARDRAQDSVSKISLAPQAEEAERRDNRVA